MSKEGREWYSYIDPNITLDVIEGTLFLIRLLTFLAISINFVLLILLYN